MKFNVGALSLTIGLFWGGSILLVGLADLAWPGYGRQFLELAASIYPGYDAIATIGQVVVGTLYGLVDGAIGGAVFGWIYNWLSQYLTRHAARSI
jgi:hypothetical protein